MNLTEYRQQMDELDRALTALFVRRMQLSEKIAACKREHGLPITDGAREAQKLDEVQAMVPIELSDYVNELYRTLFDLSKRYQRALAQGEVD